MDYSYINQAIAQLEAATCQLKNMVDTVPPQQAKIMQIRDIEDAIRGTLAHLEAAINPPNLENLPPDVLERAEALNIPLGDIEVQTAMVSHDLSQIMAILTEMENRAQTIRRRREYFLVRVPDMPIEPLGSRLPVYTAADFKDKDSSEPVPKEVRDQLKVKYGIDRLIVEKSVRSRTTLFDKIKQAKQILEHPDPPNPETKITTTSPTIKAKPTDPNSWELDNNIPF